MSTSLAGEGQAICAYVFSYLSYRATCAQDHAQKDEGRDDCAGQKVHPRQHAGDGVTVADEVRRSSFTVWQPISNNAQLAALNRRSPLLCCFYGTHDEGHRKDEGDGPTQQAAYQSQKVVQLAGSLRLTMVNLIAG